MVDMGPEDDQVPDEELEIAGGAVRGLGDGVVVEPQGIVPGEDSGPA